MKAYLYICAMSFISCGSLKKTKLLEKQERIQIQAQENIKHFSANRNSLRVDSASEFINITMKPKGIFKMDWEKGFEGEALNLSISGRKEKVRLALQNQREELIGTSKKSQINEQSVVASKIDVVRKSFLNWSIFILIIIVLMIYWWCQKLK